MTVPTRSAHTIAAVLLAGLGADGIAQAQPPLPYNRSIGEADISYAPSPDGAGMVISAVIGIDSPPDVVRDLSCLLTVTVNGIPVGGGGGGGGGGTDIRIIVGPGIPSPIGEPANCQYFCGFNCAPGNWCGPINPGTCMCISNDLVVPLGGGGVPVSVHVASLATGDVLTIGVTPAPSEPGGSDPLPEVDTSDDSASVVVSLPGCPADFDGNGVREVPDIFALLAAWFAHDARADWNQNGGYDIPDIFTFLAAWFAGCP